MTKKRLMKLLRPVFPSETSVRNLADCAHQHGIPYAFALAVMRPCIKKDYEANGTPLPRELRREQT